MNIDNLLQQLRYRSRTAANAAARSRARSKKKKQQLGSKRHSAFQSLEARRLLAADVDLVGNTLSVTDQSGSNDEFTVEISSGRYVISSNSPLTTSGFVDLNSDANVAEVAVGSINAVEIRGEAGADTLTLKNLSGTSVQVHGGTGSDVYELQGTLGNTTLVDTGGGDVDLSAISSELTVTQSGGNFQIQSISAGQVAFNASSGFQLEPSTLDQTTVQSALNDGLSKLQQFGDALADFDAMGRDLPLLNGQSLGNFLPVGSVLGEAIVQPTADYFTGAGSSHADVLQLVELLNAVDGSGYSGPGSLALSVDASAIINGDVITFEVSVNAAITHVGEQLTLPDQIVSLNDTLDASLSIPGLTANVVSQMQVDLKFGVDATGSPTFFAGFDSDLDASADINIGNAQIDLEAGLLGLQTGAHGPGGTNSTITLDARTKIDTTSLGGGDGLLSASELENTSTLNGLTPDAAATAQSDVEIYAVATAVSGITDSTAAAITFSDDGWSASPPVFTENLTTLGIDPFFNLDKDAVLQVMQQVGTYLNTLSLKAIDTERILLGETKTFGDLVDIENLYRDEFLKRIELPPNVATVLIADLVRQDNDETLVQAFGTSGDSNPEFNITLRDSSKSFDVDVDGATTLGDVVTRISVAAVIAGVSATDFTVVTDSDGLITLVDRTAESSSGTKFSITAKQDSDSEDYAAAANLGLTTPATESGDHYVITLAPNPGANFTTLQEMLALPTGAGDGAPFTSIGPLSYDATDSTFAFTIDIAKTFADATDALQIPGFGALGSLDTNGTLSIDDPTASLHLPLEISLTELGFSAPLSTSTSISELNADQGVSIVDGDADIRIHVADGRSFEINFDQDLTAIPITFLNGNVAVPTTGDSNDDLFVTLNDGTTFGVDVDAAVASSGLAPATLGELVDVIQTAADDASAIPGTAAAGTTADVIVDAAANFGTDDSLVGRTITVGTETRSIIANTIDTLTLDSTLATRPVDGDTYTVDSRLAGFATLDPRRGVLQLTDSTSVSGAPAFSVTGTSAAALGLGGSVIARNTTGQTFFSVEKSLVILDDYISLIEDAATNAGLNVAATNNFNEDWDFDVQINDDGIVLVDRTTQASAITGAAVAGAEINELQVAGSFPVHADDALVGRVVTITSGTANGESLMVTGNTGNTLTLEADWSAVLDATSQFEIVNDLIVAELNNSGARIALGLATPVTQQASGPEASLFDGDAGVGIRTNGTSSADFRITLSGGFTSFDVDLDSGLPLATMQDVADRIASAALAAGVGTDRFEVFYEQGRNQFFLIDRDQAGSVGSFVATNLGAVSRAATDLGLDVATAENIDVSTPEDSTADANEFVMVIESPSRKLGGLPLHGDTPAAHFSVAQSATPTIEVSMGISASGATGSGLYGPVSVDFTDLTINGTGSQITTSLTLDPATVSQLWTGLSNPFPWLAGDAVEFDNPLDLSLNLKPVPAIAGVNSAVGTDFLVNATNLYDVRNGIEEVTPSLPGTDEVKQLLVATEQFTIADAFESLDSVSDYLLTLQTQSRLADRLPGLSASVGELFQFGDRFLNKLNELKSLPPELQPASIQDLASQLSSALVGGSLDTSLQFSAADQSLSFGLNLDLDAIHTPVPVKLDLTKLGLDLTSFGLQKVASINDTLRQSPATVDADGQINVDLQINLSDPANPLASLGGANGLGTGTEASFEVTASNVDAFSFTTLLGSVPAEVLSGGFVLDADGSGASTAPAVYQVELQTDATINDLADVELAAAGVQTPVTINGVMDATYEFAFPEQIVPTDAPTTLPSVSVSVGDLNVPTTSTTLTTNLDGAVGNWPEFETLTQNFSLANSMDGFRLGFFELFTDLDAALDTTLLGRDLPLVGSQLGEAADFLLQMRDAVVDNLSLYGSTTIESVQQSLFDAFGPGGFNWLQNDPDSGDSAINIEDVKVIAQTIVANGNSLVTGVQFDMDLEMSPELLRSAVDLDLLLPGLGLETNAQADVLFGFKFPLSVGVSIADGVYLNVDQANDLEISLDVSLPTASVTIQDDPSLTFVNASGSNPTLSRDRGNWILDGFQVGQIIAVTNSASNDGQYLIRSIDSTGLELTLESPNTAFSGTTLSQVEVIQEGPTSGVSVSVSDVTAIGKPTLTFADQSGVSDSITRSTGNWREDGYSEGDLVDVYGTASNDGSYRVFHIDPTGRILSVEGDLQSQTTADAVVMRTQAHTLSGRLGVLPVRIWDNNPDQSKLTGTFVIDWLDPAVIGGNQRLSANDLTSEAPFQIEPQRGFTSAPLPSIVSISESSSDPLTLNPLSLMLETDLPRTAAFSPYRMQLDVTNWDWQINDSLATELSTPTVAFNNVQFDLVGFTRDFMGPAITRLSQALDSADDILRFLQSEAMPILSLLFGRKSYAASPDAFGGTSQQGNFVGAAVAIRALARGGDPFERDAITETFSDIFGESEFDNITLRSIATLTGEQWIDIGKFVVDGAVARNGSDTGTLLDTAANVERQLGSKNDRPLRLTGSPNLQFNGSTIGRSNATLNGSMSFSRVPAALGTGKLRINAAGINSQAFGKGDSIYVSGTGAFDGKFIVESVSAGEMIVLEENGVVASTSLTTTATIVGTARTWVHDGLTAGTTIEIIGGPNAGFYTISSATETQVTVAGGAFPQPETVLDSVGIDIVAINADGTRGGSIMGQIAGFARDRTSSVADAAKSFVTTQLIPGLTRLGAGLEILPAGVQSAIRQFSSGSVQPIDLPILEHSFELLLGDTSFNGASEEDSNLLSYSTPELSYLLYQMIPLKWEMLLGKLIHPIVGEYIGKPLDSSSYVVPFISVAFEARADYALAFDTTGLQRFGYTGNPEDIINGFYFDDFEGVEPNPSLLANTGVGKGNQSGASTGFNAKGARTRRDEAQVRILGGIGLGLFVDPFLTLAGGKFKNFIQARAGFEISFFIGQDQNFTDPDGDGRVRTYEFDGLTDFQINTLTGDSTAEGKEAFDNSIRIEIRLDVFASIKVGIFLTQKPPIFGLKIGFDLFSIRLNVITFGFNIPLTSESYTPPDLANLGGGALNLVLSNSANNRVYVGATSAPDDQNRQDIVVSGRGFYESFKAVSSISGVAGSGDDFIFIMPNVFLPATIDGGSGSDVIFGGSGNDTLIGGGGDDFIDGRMGDDTIYGDDLANATSGLDWLLGGVGDDRIFGGAQRDVIRGLRDDDNIDGGSGDDLIDGGTGVDTVDGGDGVDHILGGIGRDSLTGGSGDDRIEGGRDADDIRGGTGSDLVFGGLGNDTIDGEAGEDTLFGEQHNDTIDGGDGSDHLDGGFGGDVIRAGAGDDLIVSVDGNDVLDGQIGDDTYRVAYADGKAVSLIRIVESGPAEDTDVFVAIGTLASDQFLLRASVSQSNAFVALLTDPDHSPSDAAYSPSVQRVNYAGVERIVVNGGLGNDHFAVDDTAAEITINGESGEDSFQIGQLFRSERNEVDANVSVDDVFATIETTRGFLSNGISQPMTINGGLGNDRFVVFHNKAVLSLNGDAGDDDFEVRAFALVGSREPERERTDITGGAGADLVQYAVNAPVNINGGEGFDTLTVIGTEFGDDFVVTEKGVFGAGLTINFTRIESLRVDGAEGDDRFYVKSTGETFLTELFGGLGDDTFNMSGDAPPVVSNDLLGHSGIVAHGVSHSTDLRFEDLKVDGVSANVADNDEPFVVIRPSGGSTIVTETSGTDASLFDYYEVVLSRAPLIGFDVLVKALAPLPTPDRRDIGARSFRLNSPAVGAEEKQDGSVVTLRFTAENWATPQRVEVRADGVTQKDTGGVFTRTELSQSVEFTYNDNALEGEQSAIINHLVVSAAATAHGSPLVVVAQPTITIATNRPFFEFVGETIQITNQGNSTVQTRRIVSARLVDGNMQLTVNRSWLEGAGVPTSTSSFDIDLDGTTLSGNPIGAVNPTFTIPETLDPFNPFLDSASDLLGRQVSIVNGQGVGQSRFITGADAVVALSGSAGNVFSPNVAMFVQDLSEGSQSVDATSGATLRVVARGDFDGSFETLVVTIDGTNIGTLFGGRSGRLYTPIEGSLFVSQSDLQGFLSDGELDIRVTPSIYVDNFGGSFGETSLSIDLEYSVDATSADFNKDVIGDLRLTLDRGWQPGNVPNVDSSYQIRVDDSLIGKATGFDEAPIGLPVDSSFPPELDTRTTFSDSAAAFDDAEFGPEGLRGATLEIVGGPGAGQQRLVLGHLDSTTLILNGGWNTDPIAGESLYRINRYDGLAVSSVSVFVNDNDAAGLIVDQTRGFDSASTDPVVQDIDTVTAVIEGGDGDQLGEQEVVRVRLSRQPTSSVNVLLEFDGVQLAIENVDGSPIADNTLSFNAANWDTYQDVVVLGLHDNLREGFHTTQIKFVTSSADVNVTPNHIDDFTIPTTAPVSLVGLSRQASLITDVLYNNQSLLPYDPQVIAGTQSQPVWQLVSNQIVFHAGTEFASVSGNSLDIHYEYVNPGYNDTFTQPLLVRISDADAPSVLIRETGGSTDVVEGAASFTQVEIAGADFGSNTLTDRVVEIVGGTGVGQSATVIGNEGNTLTLDQLWAVTPDATSKLTISNDPISGVASLGVISSSTTHPFQRRSHTLALVAGVSYTFDLEGTATGKGTNRDPFLWVHDPFGRQVAANDDSGVGLNSRLSFTPFVTGNHTLLAGGYGFNFGSYTLTTQFTQDIAGSTATTASVFAPGSLSSSIQSATDQDWIAVEMSVGNSYTFDLEGSPTNQGTLADPFLRLLDSDGVEIETDDNSGTGNNSQITFLPTTTGTYYLSVEGATTGTGSYRFSTTTVEAQFDVASASIQSFANDHYEVVLTAQPERGTATTGEVRVTVTPEITKTTRTGGVRTDAKQVEIYSLDGLPASRVEVDGDNLIVIFNETNWDEPVRIGVRAIDDTKVDGGDTKVFADGPNTVSRILGPVILDGAGGDGSLSGLGDPEKFPFETNVKAKTGDIESITDNRVTLQSLDPVRISALGLQPDLSDVLELVGKTLEVVATNPTADWLATFPTATTGNPNDPVVGQFRLITEAVVENGKIVVTLNERFGVGGDEVGTIVPAAASTVQLKISREQRLRLGLNRVEELPGRFLELSDANGNLLSASRITSVVDDGDGQATLTVDADLATSVADASNFFIRNDDLIQSYAITSESLNFFVDENESVDFAFIHDEDSPADSTGYLTANRLWGLNMGPDITVGGRLQAGGITYNNLEVLQIDLGAGNNDFHVLGTHSRADDPTTGNDETFQTWTFINSGDDVFWPPTNRKGDVIDVSVDAADVVMVTSTASSSANPNQTSFASLVDSSSPFGADDSLAGFTLTTTNSLGTIQTRSILGNTADTVFIDGIWAELPILGDSYEIINPADGAIAINTQDGDDVIDASDSTLGVVVFGGLGLDTITGGSGEDILFGDQGRVDYFGTEDGSGISPVVTRLGESPEPILGSVTGDFGNDTTVLDANANFPASGNFDIGLQGLYVDINNGTGFLQRPRLITGNTTDTLDVSPAFTETLDLTSEYRISTLPEDQTDGVVRGANLIVTVNDLQGDADIIVGGDGLDQIFGGAGDDDIDGQQGNDIILGDTGVIHRAAVPAPANNAVARTSIPSILDLVQTKTPDAGGSDLISGGDDDDLVLGGFGTDYINFDRLENQLVGETGDDLILGDNGLADFDVTSGSAVLVRVETNEAIHGSTDFITAGDGEKLIFGGAGDDQLLAGSDALPDIILGDEGVAYFDPVTGVRLNLETTTPTIGGDDTITAGNAFNILLGGSGNDRITGGDFRDVIVGDNGRVDFVAFDTDPTSLDQVITIDQTFGGIDTIFGGDDNDIIIGGAFGDVIQAGGGHDVVFGDHAEIDYSRPVDRNVISRFITAADGGGDDTIHGDDGDDFVFGGQGDDTINGDAGQDDIVGGHNVVFGVDGDDTIDGGDDEDVILGDNGVIKRNLLSTQLGTWENYLAPFDSIVIRSPQPFDDQDLIQGDDTIRGGAGMDILRGQRGDDEIHGGDESDEIIGGLGADNLFGDAGQDFILADAGQILRDFNDDAAPQLNSDGTWHRDLLTESIGRVTNIIPTDPAGLNNLPVDLADQLLDADHVIFGGVQLPSGIQNLDFESSQWETVSLLIDNVGVDGTADDDTIDGGEGNDFILGQHGDDTIRGGDGDDTLVGDHGINIVPMETDLPQMLHSIRLIGVDAGAETLSGIGLVLPAFGHVIVPEIVAEPGDLVSERPRWDRISPVNAELAAIATGDDLTTTDDLRISPSISMTPAFIGHSEVLDGNDTIQGDDGADLIFGDKLIVTSDLQTGIDPIVDAIERTSASVAAAMFALEGLSLDRDVVRYEVNAAVVAERTIRVGSDVLEGGDGADTVVGDNGTYELPATHSLPGTGVIADDAASLQQHLANLETIGDDATSLVTVAHLSVTDLLLADAAAKRPTLPAITSRNADYVQHHELVIGEDTVRGDDGNDTLLGGDALFIAPVVTGTLGDLPQSVLVDGLDSDDLRSLVDALEFSADAQAVELNTRRAARSVNVVEELARRTPLNRISYVPSFDRELDNDTIEGGLGNDIVAGDESVIATPLVLQAPTTQLELNELDRHVELLLDQIADQDRSAAVISFDDHIGRQRLRDSVTDAMAPESRVGAIDGNWEVGEDVIEGNDGDDLLLGDHVAIVSPLMIDDVGRQVTLTRSAYGIGYLEDAMREFLDNTALDRVDVDLSGDRIVGGDGEDVLLGSVGEDRLEGNDGNDTLRGGNQKDILIGGAGTNQVRTDGGNYPNVELSETLGVNRFASTPELTTQLYLDAADGASMPVNWVTTTTTNPMGGETGDPDTPTPPVARTVQIAGDSVAVIGQPFQFSATITDLPAGASERFLWEVTDASGSVVAVGQGPRYEFTPSLAGNFTVKAVGSDNQNGLGETSVMIDVQNVRLIADPSQPGKSILVVGGTAGDDDIRLNDVRRKPNSVQVRISNGGPWAIQTYDDISRIDVYGGEGNDDLTGDKRLVIPLRLYGGAGDDKLRGGAASDFLDGGAGKDRLLGQDGDDILIGGLGADRLDGGDDEDLLISDQLTATPGQTDADALMSRWAGAGTSVADRMADLITDLSSARKSDGALDSLDGDDGTDWFFAQATDEIIQRRRANDVKTLF